MIEKILENAAPDERARQWVAQRLEKIDMAQPARDFYLSFGLAYRHIPRVEVNFDATDRQTLESVYPQFTQNKWTADQLIRLRFMLALPAARNKEILEKLFTTADINELIVLYRGLYLLPNARDFTLRAVEGIRTNMASVFDAIALHNPFPAEYFAEEAWNQMVLKAVFMERPIFRIYGLDQRANRKLAKIAQDFAHERWSAGRAVTPELWRLTEGFVDATIFVDLQKAISQDTPLARAAAVQVIENSDYQPAKDWLSAQQLSSSKLSWNEIGAHLLAGN